MENNNVEIIDDVFTNEQNQIAEGSMPEFKPLEEIEMVEEKNEVEPTVVEPVRVETPVLKEINTDIDSVLYNLESDVAGARNFMSSFEEQRKKIELNENYLAEKTAKLEKDRADFEKFKTEQTELIQLSRQKLEEFEKNQKVRLQTEEAQFNQEVEAMKAEMALQNQTIKNGQEQLGSEKQQFAKYKEAEENILKVSNQKLSEEKQQFEKYKDVEEDKIKLAKEEIDKYREQTNKENDAALNLIKVKEAELEEQKIQFEKYKEVEKKKLELESNNLSQSYARFKGLVSQFNVGFQQFSEDK